MIPISQGKTRNCLSCCVASLLEIPVSLVPDFGKYRSGSTQDAALSAWLIDHYGLAYLEMPAATAMRAAIPAVGIVSVRYSRKFWHAVVGRALRDRIEILHDPDHSEEARPGDLTHIGYLIPLQDRIRLCCAAPPPGSSPSP